MRRTALTIALLMVFLATVGSVQADVLYSGSFEQNNLRVIDPSDGSELDAISLSLPGKEILGIKALATHPVTGILYALPFLDGTSLRELVTIDLDTGIATSIGTTDSGHFWQGLAFDATGTLYRIDLNADLVTLSLADASSSFVKTLSDVGSTTLIAFNPLDGFMYHRSGSFFEKLDLGTLMLTTIPGPSLTTPNGLTFSSVLAKFILADDSSLYSLTAAGVETFIASMDHTASGVAFSSRTLPSLSLPAALYGASLSFDFDVSDLWAIDPATGVARRVAKIDDGGTIDKLTNMDFHPITNTLYAIIRSGATNKRISIDHLTGAFTVIAPLTGAGIGRPRDVSFRGSDGVLFGFDGDDLYTIDTGTGVGTPVGLVFENGRPNGMAFSPTGQLFMAQDDELHRLDPDNVIDGEVEDNFVATFINPFNDVHGFPTMDFQPGTGTLFGVFKQDQDEADVDNYLVTVSTNPGTMTNIGQTAGDRMDALAFFPSSGAAGDGNGDGDVDAGDLSFCAGLLGGVNAACDLDGDGTVEVEDIKDLVGVIFGVVP